MILPLSSPRLLATSASTNVTIPSLDNLIKNFNFPTSLDAFTNSSRENQLILSGLIGVGGVTFLLLLNKLFGTDPIGRTLEMFSTFSKQEKTRNIKVDQWIDQYNDLHKGDTADQRNSAYTTLVNSYYELATLFYEWGWGQSFHFAYQLKGESFKEAIARHEYYLAGRLGVQQGDKILDVGCGIGGPMRNIARFTRAQVTGVTLNEYQVQRGNELNKAAGLEGRALSVQADFMKLPFTENSFDGVYAIEATCHAPRRQDVYGEIFRVLKPGQVSFPFPHLGGRDVRSSVDKGGSSKWATNYRSELHLDDVMNLF
jgi:2-polyprenyl-3-methyl-5-hydroxy-6-metoxy-1,4-benzoquinol methylase